MHKCDVCGMKVEKTVVACSACGPVSFSYCARCGAHGYEPYIALVGAAVEVGVTDSLDCFSEWFQTIVKNSLEFHNVSVQEFIDDVKIATKEYWEELGVNS